MTTTRHSHPLLALLLIGLLTMTACGSDPDPAEAAADVEASRSRVQEAMRAVADVATTQGLEIAEATGSWSVCSDPPRLKYAAGGAATPAANPAGSEASVPDAVAALTDALADDGWEVEDAGTEPEAYGVLTRDGVRASVGESRRTPGAVSVGVTGECVETTQEQDALLGERDRVIG